MTTAIVLYADGSAKEVSPANGKKFAYEEVYALLGPNVTTIRAANALGVGKGGLPVPGLNILVVDEEAAMKVGRVLNRSASRMVGYLIYGNVLYCGKKQFDS